MIIGDIDHFKRVNDTLGHLAGDQVIRDVCRRILGALRKSDILARWGGEELIILLHDCGLPDALEVAEKVRQLVADTTFVEMPDGSNVTISFGVTEAMRNDDADSIVGRADKAVYEAKQQGRNRVRAAD